MAVGRWPGLKVDRTGIALLGAILLYGSGAIGGAAVLAAIDFPTLIVLFGLMILSAQFAACGFYDWCSARIATTEAPPAALLAITVATAGHPCGGAGQRRRGVRDDADAVRRACSGAASIRARSSSRWPAARTPARRRRSSAIPQNILIGEVGRLEFWRVPRRLRAAGARRPRLRLPGGLVAVANAPDCAQPAPPAARRRPTLDRPGLAKAAFATLLLLVLFATPLPHVTGVLVVAGYLLISRRLATRTMLGLVDWHLLVLFGGPVRGHRRARHDRPARRALVWLAAQGLGARPPGRARAARADWREHHRQRAAGRAPALGHARR